ncbi:MAG TPA: sigma-70 family RNA polymerase sigma factor [Myxococcota bacterium]|jgi:RNA polymerase sigma-70 factor (ECF subfamily)
MHDSAVDPAMNDAAPPSAASSSSSSSSSSSFDAAYREHKTYVWHALRRLGVSDADRPDLVHDVFMVFWRRRAELDVERAVKPWLFGIAYRVVLGHRRRLVRRPEDQRDELEMREAAVAATQDDVVDKKRAQALLQTALAAMDLDQRAVFVLHDVDGENVAACARALDVSVNTLYSRLRLARKKLADVVAASRSTAPGGSP